VVILEKAKLSEDKLEVGLCRDPKDYQAVRKMKLGVELFRGSLETKRSDDNAWSWTVVTLKKATL
jgi:hypothetical protein